MNNNNFDNNNNNNIQNQNFQKLKNQIALLKKEKKKCKINY